MTPQSHLHLAVWQSMETVNHCFCARSATEGSITIGLRGALGVEITHQTVNVDLHSGYALLPHQHQDCLHIVSIPLGSHDEYGDNVGINTRLSIRMTAAAAYCRMKGGSVAVRC
jgi:hypothetical protein